MTTSIHAEEFLIRIGKRLRQKRVLRDDRLKNVSAHLGVSHAMLSRIENGKYKLSIELLLKMAEYYETEPAEFFQ